MADEHRANGHSQPQREPAQQPRPRKKRARRRRSAGARIAGALLYVLLVIGVSAVLATLGWTWACDLLGLNKEYASTTVTIQEDTDFNTIVDQLEAEGLIQYKFLFKLYTRFSHAQDKIAPGTYELNTEMDYHALVSSMGSSSATRLTTDITIKEGLTIDQVFALLEERGVTSVDKLRDMAADYDYAFSWLRDRPLGDYHRLEGYLFPDTYTFELGENPKYVINKMLVNFDAKMDEYFAPLANEEAAYHLHDIVTIASLIEKETDGQDYRTISSVIYNRLENPGAETAGFLNIDATLVYLNGGKVPTEADKAIDSPYNTYLYQGLPAGPIANPGMEALLAAMNPESTKYYFYVLNPETKQHEFSRTFSEHNALVNKYGTNG
ncbi:MAG: endolytic transglycosylase MltG [Clostridiales bacterium]|nr:endolytic transglycosylase MltG [Clostridiales bacterium]